MDQQERAFIESLLQTHRSHLQVLEQQAATFGVMAPPYVVTQIAEYRQKIVELEARLRPAPSRSAEGPRHNLPPRDYERFVGRQKELAEVRRLLGPRSRSFIVTIDGIGGIGKSTLALETAYTFIDQYAEVSEQDRFEANVWVSAKRTYLTASGIHERRQVFRTLEDVFAAIARVLDYPAITRARTEEQRAIVEQVLREQRTLLILDNLETVDDEELLDFLHELPEPTKALVTTRHRIDVARPVRLKDMELGDALALIVQEAIRKDVSLTADQQKALLQHTGGVPLAILWSIGLMGLGSSIESVLQRLDSGQSDITKFCFDESVAQIREHDAYWILLALALFATDADRKALGFVAGLGENTSNQDNGLGKLLQLSLVNKEGDRFSLLPLTRNFAISKSLDHVEWIQIARNRMHIYFGDFVKKYGGKSQDWRGHDLVEQELNNIIFVIKDLLADLEYPQDSEEKQEIPQAFIDKVKMIIGVIKLTGRTCRVRGYWNDCEYLWRNAIDVAKIINDTSLIVWHYYDLARLEYDRGDIESAARWNQEAHDEWSRQNKQKAISDAYRLFGLIALYKGDIGEAEDFLQKGWRSYNEAGGWNRLSIFMESLGDLALRRSDYEGAASWCEQAVERSREKNDIYYLSSHFLLLGKVKFATGDAKEAQTYYEKSLELSHTCGRAEIIARSRYCIAELRFRSGQYRDAESSASQALDLFRRLGMKREQADAEALLAKLTQGSPEPAQDQ
jgi:tetratricopeptide (TPR) repeat protein